jgi:predicted phosphodiesterase
MSKYCFIGDTHGKLERYFAICEEANKEGYVTVSLGDNGFLEEYQEIGKTLDPKHNLLLQGNHDYYGTQIELPHVLGHSGMHNSEFFYVRGANSIDKAQRIEGRDWFREEELEYGQQMSCLYSYETLKPEIVISHDCPQTIRTMLFNINESSSTANLLDELLLVHRPKLWLFGHHHAHRNFMYRGTLFMCLRELQTFKLGL